MRRVYSVGQVNHYIRGLLAGDAWLSGLFVRGEVSNCKYHSSGHIYFSLKDETGSLSAVMFARDRRGLDFPMKNGDRVVVSGRLDVYEKTGVYQLYATGIRQEGAGELFERYIALRKELEERGLFSPIYKKPIPSYARRIGIVTSPTGAAIQDIRNIAARRNPYVQLILCPALVQGEGAKESIVRGIRRLDALGVDVIIVGRGGGSMEDLWAFNEECVAEAIFACRTPVISAVGHETDTTIADLTADLRAPTPSAAAELAVFDYEAFCRRQTEMAGRLSRALRYRLAETRRQAAKLRVRLAVLSPESRLRDETHRAALYADRLQQLMEKRIALSGRQAELFPERFRTAASHRLLEARHTSELLGAALPRGCESVFAARAAMLQAWIARMKGLNPLDRLSQGYAYVENEARHSVSGWKQVSPGESLTIYVADGRIRASVTGAESVEWSGRYGREDHE